MGDRVTWRSETGGYHQGVVVGFVASASGQAIAVVRWGWEYTQMPLERLKVDQAAKHNY